MFIRLAGEPLDSSNIDFYRGDSNDPSDEYGLFLELLPLSGLPIPLSY